MRRPRLEDLILPAVALLVVVADQVSKVLVVRQLELGQSMDLTSWLAPVFRITYVTNTGVAFGLLPGMGELFVVIAIVVIVLLLFYHRQLPSGQVLVRAALGLQLGGALGNNLIDRLVRGSVVDFIDLNFWPLRRWPVFNLADTSIVTGAVLLGLTILWEETQYQEQEQEQEGEEE